MNFLIYHSGFVTEKAEGAYDPKRSDGVDALCTSLIQNGVKPNSNVFAELGSTWRFAMRDPDNAAHLMGKLFKYCGENNVLWGTDSVWYGSPQDQIQAFRTFQIAEQLREKHGYPQITPALRAKVFGLNALKVYAVPDDIVRKHMKDRVALDRAESRERPDPAFVTWAAHAARVPQPQSRGAARDLIVTPGDSEPLIDPVAHASPRSFVFSWQRDPLFLSEADAALPDGDRGGARDRPGELQAVACGTRLLPAPLGCPRTCKPPPEPCVQGHALALRALRRAHACGCRAGVPDRGLGAHASLLRRVRWPRMTRTPGERAMKCACGHLALSAHLPAMMVLVKRGPAILLARNVAVPAGGRMSALAGFLEPGESIEDAIHREVREEVGVDVKDLRYFASQSWPYPHSLMIAFTAEYAGGELKLDPNEIAEARWFGPGDTLPELSPKQSISRALIDANLP